MEILKELTDHTVIVCENNYKKKLLKQMTNQKLFLNVKFFSKKEFFNKYLFAWDEKVLYYLTSKYKIKVDIAKGWLNNLYYIDDSKNYQSSKLKKLQDIKIDLKKKDLLIYNNDFKDTLLKNKIIIWGYEYLEKYEEDIFASLKALIFTEEEKYLPNKVYEFERVEEECNYVAKEICKLILSGVDINQIKIANVSNDYYNTLNRIFKLYNLPIKVPYQNSLYSNLITQIFLNNFQSDIKKSIESINSYDSKIVNKIIEICNKYSFADDYNEVKDLIVEDLKNTTINNFNLKNYVEVVDLNEPFTSEYVFLMNFNTGVIPFVLKDESYITDNIRSEVSSKMINDINKEIKKYTIKKIKSIKNLVITYKLKTDKQEYYPSFLIGDLGCEVEKGKIDILNSYSKLNDEINYAKKIDNYLKYGQIDESYYTYQSSFPNISYNTYDNKYQKVNTDLLKDYLNKKLVLSYSSLNNYNKCAFRYYLANILKLDKYEENFEAFIGSIFHDVLEKCFIYNLNVLDEINNYIKDKNKTLSIKERFFVNKVAKDIEYVINVLKKQNKNIKLDQTLYEKEIVIDKSTDDTKVEFIGYVDKILYKETGGKTLVSIIDYKTGFIDIELKYIPYGLSLQLPIYLYLVKNSNLFVNPKFVGFYLQYILDKDILRLPNKSYDVQKEDNLKLMGYSLKDPILLEWFDESYANSNLIKGMKTKADGNFGAYAKVLSEKQIDKIIDLTEENVDKAINNILNAEFNINPKKIGYQNEVGCQYCKFKDICFKKECDDVILDEVDNLDFLGGEEDA